MKIHINRDCQIVLDAVILQPETKPDIHNLQQSVTEKYNIPVPRYTSYPPANYFRAFSEEDYMKAVSQSNNCTDRHVSFYLHLPFCHHLCHYCACNSYAMRSPEVVSQYLKALHQEIDLLLPLIVSDRQVSQIHYGGGSPTAIAPDAIRLLNQHLLSVLDTIERPEIAIECHPGYLSLTSWKQLLEAGFTRFSIGVQDFDTDVLRIVNRRPSQEALPDIFSVLRDGGARINLDFLYGLPGQTTDSFCRTIDYAISLHPDRLVTFSYAHVPWLKRQQLVLEKAGLPTNEEKARMFLKAEQRLIEAGYVRIGMDHFVLPDDELYQAMCNGQLHRNFQGYCTRRTTGQVYAFGATGISQLETAYAQNTKDIDTYIATVNRGHLPVSKGYSLTTEEQQIRQVIEQLMCNYHMELPDDQINNPRLKEMADDGLITLRGNMVAMTKEGQPFVRNVAAAIDPLMQNTQKLFSKPI